jgi:hypothetical protein
MTTSPTFKRLVRFEDAEKQIHYGEIPAEISLLSDLIGLKVPIYEGNAPWDTNFLLTPRREAIVKVR